MLQRDDCLGVRGVGLEPLQSKQSSQIAPKTENQNIRAATWKHQVRAFYW